MVTDREIAERVAWSFLGKPYIWGGDDPIAGFDCSGFVIEILRSVGILPRAGDWTAAQLMDKFPIVSNPTNGCLVFWENAEKKVIHVEYCLDSRLSIGASGGGSKTITVEDAIKQNAYIRIRPFRERTGIAGYCDPFMV
jgi:cell wall-associated NlpC family hydrolase